MDRLEQPGAGQAQVTVGHRRPRSELGDQPGQVGPEMADPLEGRRPGRIQDAAHDVGKGPVGDG